MLLLFFATLNASSIGLSDILERSSKAFDDPLQYPFKYYGKVLKLPSTRDGLVYSQEPKSFDSGLGSRSAETRI